MSSTAVAHTTRSPVTERSHILQWLEKGGRDFAAALSHLGRTGYAEDPVKNRLMASLERADREHRCLLIETVATVCGAEAVPKLIKMAFLHSADTVSANSAMGAVLRGDPRGARPFVECMHALAGRRGREMTATDRAEIMVTALVQMLNNKDTGTQLFAVKALMELAPHSAVAAQGLNIAKTLPGAPGRLAKAPS